MKHFIKFLVVLTLASGCGEEDPVPIDKGEAFFPLTTGFYQIYKVTETRYSPSTPPETLTYELRHEVTDSFPSAQNECTYIIQRSKRLSQDMDWEPLETWSARREGNDIIVSEGSTSYIKVRLPVRDGVRWDGNRYNTLGEDEYLIRDAGISRQYGGMAFERTMTVEQEDNEDLIVYQDRRSEVYATGAGMIYRKLLQLTYCSEDRCLGQQKIDHGVDMEMELTDYGAY